MYTDKDKLLFLQSFSDQDYILNEHKKEDYKYILDIYNLILPYINNGNYIELGCGTGIVAKFYKIFSLNNIVPYGIDINEKSILLAKNNNKNYKNNFQVGDYFSHKFIKKYNTIILYSFFIFDDNVFKKYYKLLFNIYNNLSKGANFILYCSNDGFFTLDNKYIYEILKIISMKYIILKKHKNFLILTKK